MARVFRIRTAEMSDDGAPAVAWCAAFAWDEGYHLHVLEDVREPVRMLNPTGKHPDTGLQSVLWGNMLEDLVGVSGGFTVRRMPEPEWWNRTEAEARALVGLDP